MSMEQAIRRRETQKERDKKKQWWVIYARLRAEARKHANTIGSMIYAEGLEAGWHYPLSNYKDGQIYKEDSMRRLAS